MTTEINSRPFASISWQWIVVSYCYLIIFHLFPTLDLLSSKFAYSGGLLDIFGILEGREILRLAIWTSIGIGAVSTFTAFRALKPRILEPAIASVFYCLTVVFCLQAPVDAPYYYRQPGFVASMCLVCFVVAFAFAGSTVLVRMRREL